MDYRTRANLDAWITGHYGEDQWTDSDEAPQTRPTSPAVSPEEAAAAVAAILGPQDAPPPDGFCNDDGAPEYRYTMKYRPPGYATLPSGLEWRMVERGRQQPDGYERRADLHIGKYPHGIFATTRRLTPAELVSFEIVEVFPTQ